LAARDQNLINEAEEENDWNQEDGHDDAGAVKMNATHLFVVLSEGPGDESLDCAVQAHSHGKDQDVQKHIAETHSRQKVTAHLANIENIEELYHLEEDHRQNSWRRSLDDEPEACQPGHIFGHWLLKHDACVATLEHTDLTVVKGIFVLE